MGITYSSKIKKAYINLFGGDKKTEPELKDYVYWQTLKEKDEVKHFNEEETSTSYSHIISYRDQYITSISIDNSNSHITRASVYVDDEGEPHHNVKQKSKKIVNNVTDVNKCNYKLLKMERENVNALESDISPEALCREPSHSSLYMNEEFNDTDASITEFQKMNLNGKNNSNQRSFGENCDEKFDSNISLVGTSDLSTFTEDIENYLQDCSHTKFSDSENKFESSNSLNIEKELTTLLGALCNGNERKYSADRPNENTTIDNRTSSKHLEQLGSQINLGFESTELNTEENEYHSVDSLTTNKNCPTSTASLHDYWENQRIQSKSFSEKHKIEKLLRKGKQRMSMIELRNKKRRTRGSEFDDYVNFSNKFESGRNCPSKPFCFARMAYDRSSMIEDRVCGAVTLPARPMSAMASDLKAGYITSSSGTRELTEDSDPKSPVNFDKLSSNISSSSRTSKNSNEYIDWSWVEEAMKSLNSECQESVNGNLTLRIDAGCQTQIGESGERVLGRAPSLRAPDAGTGELRVTESSLEEVPNKQASSGGLNPVSNWLRQSMRRIRRFNLDDLSILQSDPPVSLRIQISDERESTASQIIPNNPSLSIYEEQQLSTDGVSEESRFQGRRDRSRPATPSTRSTNETISSQNQQPTEVDTIRHSSGIGLQENPGYESDSTDHPSLCRGRQRHVDSEEEEPVGRSPLGSWPHSLSSVFAGLGCTLGLFNISRFAVLSVHFGSNFILQFLILSLVLGIPLLAFHAALGQTLGAGPVDMWKISPVFQGIGIALLLSQALIGMYSIVGVSWMFVYFRDSFITNQDSFRWAEPSRYHREDSLFATSLFNSSGRLEETVPDYLNVVVLQRHSLTSPDNAFGHLKFQLTFNLAVVWMIVFVSLSKGLRSYGKVAFVFSIIPVLGVLIICSKLLGLTPLYRGFFPQSEWSEFFLNAKSWISAATEVMLTWNLLGAATMQITSHNRSHKKLWRDITTIVLLTLLVLILAAFLGNLCNQLIFLKGYNYVPSSFERISTYSFLRPLGAPLPSSYSLPLRHMPHASLVAGDRVGKPEAIHESGYQVIRLATELIPATLTILEGNYLSPFWAVLFYFTLILFGIAQQLAIWHCVITGIMAINTSILKSWETTITFFTCAAGFILGLPMTTELGIFVVYFLDYCLGGGWWVILLTLIEICAILMVRGRPYSGENISIALFGKTTNCFSLWVVPLLTFTWNVITPVALLVMCITIFKSGGYRDLWIWKCGKGDYWPLWTREVGVFVQIIPLLCIPVVGLIQCYRYLSKGPADIFDRLANLYRPVTTHSGIADTEDTTTIASNLSPTDSSTNNTTELTGTEDPPPKYTPPPSYSTATGNRLAKLLRHSFRRSVRRIQSVLESETVSLPRQPPPDYASIAVEMNQNGNVARSNNFFGLSTNTFTAADVVQVLRCSFRRSSNVNLHQNGQ